MVIERICRSDYEARRMPDGSREELNPFKLTLPTVLMFLAVLCFVYPPMLEKMEASSTVLSFLAALRYLISIGAIVALVVRQHDGLLIASLFLFELMVVTSSMLNGTAYLTYALSCLTFVGFVALNCELYRYDGRTLIAVYKCVLATFLILDFVTRVLYPQGMVAGYVGDNRVWFLGGKTRLPLYLIAYAFFVLIDLEGKAKEDKAKDIFLLGLTCVLSLYIPSSVTVIVVAFAALLTIARLSRKKVWMPNKVFATGVLLFFVVFVLMGENNFVNNLIGALLGKDPSFSGRQSIWKMALLMIEESPWGIGPEASFNPWSNQAIYVYSAHNTFLDIAVRSGIATAIAFAAVFLVIVFRCTKRSSGGNTIAFFLVLALLASMMEANQGYYILWVLISFGVLEATIGIRPYLRGPDVISAKRCLPCHGGTAACSVSSANRSAERRTTR